MARRHVAFGRVCAADARHVFGAARAGIARTQIGTGGFEAGGDGDGGLWADAGLAATAAGDAVRQNRPQESDLFGYVGVCAGQLLGGGGRHGGSVGLRARHAGCGCGQRRGYGIAGGFDARRSPHACHVDDWFEHRPDVFRQPGAFARADQLDWRGSLVRADGRVEHGQYRAGGGLHARTDAVAHASGHAGEGGLYRHGVERPAVAAPELGHFCVAGWFDGHVYRAAVCLARTGLG